VGWSQGFFDKIESFERNVYLKSESILWARTLTGVGVLVEFLIQVGQFDISPFIVFIPPDYQVYATVFIHVAPIVVSVLGVIQERLRRDVTKPLTVVAMADSAPPEAHAAAADAEAVMKDTVNIIEQVQ
jgi:hypothetical protein